MQGRIIVNENIAHMCGRNYPGAGGNPVILPALNQTDFIGFLSEVCDKCQQIRRKLTIVLGIFFASYLSDAL